jgi:hypothetical protein
MLSSRLLLIVTLVVTLSCFPSLHFLGARMVDILINGTRFSANGQGASKNSYYSMGESIMLNDRAKWIGPFPNDLAEGEFFSGLSNIVVSI